ncbi:hypothetical protein [Streptococcus cuniculi]|uniref:CopG family transcriptional regulator n=1 Tax=Streptococcus cuniculi TaxID=1432788 RepID=A0A4Y9J841_9STRE|nr:hypothetical protein [Streptococcus cuniculi]MBF0778906.1 hypothetical protein [Streptococcus cuniculi]TFU97180.1 hypothetical protein E4T82_09270 [Streptococcus cuniculi]
MAFNGTKDDIRKALGVKKPAPIGNQSIIPVAHRSENKKQFQFTLRPSNREKLHQIAQSRGYRSDSAFLDALIENL